MKFKRFVNVLLMEVEIFFNHAKTGIFDII